MRSVPTPRAPSRNRPCSARWLCPSFARPERGSPESTAMPKRVHLVAGILALLCIAAFFVSTVFAGLFGSPEAVARLKSLIVMHGLWILIPAVAATGGSGHVRHGLLCGAGDQAVGGSDQPRVDGAQCSRWPANGRPTSRSTTCQCSKVMTRVMSATTCSVV